MRDQFFGFSPVLCVLCASVVYLAALTGCSRPVMPTPTPESPLAAVPQWANEVRSYRYERTALTVRPDGGTTIVHESGAVMPPDRQHLSLRGQVAQNTASREVIIIGDRAWVREAVLGQGRGWQPSPAETRPVDPLTLALATLAAAGPARPAGERREEDGRSCQGWTYPFDPARVAVWPGDQASGLTAEATLWREERGAVCGQTLRFQRAGLPAGEMSVTLSEVNIPLTIEPPV